MTTLNGLPNTIYRFFVSSRTLSQGFFASSLVAIAATFLSEHYGVPAMLMALLLGIAFNFLSDEGACAPGIAFTSKTVLRIGVALLGMRISVDMLIGLGPQLIGLVVGGVVLTILFGLIGARVLGRGWSFGLLTGGSVAICGASAAMAIAAVLPKKEGSERDLIFTVLAVTVLSTVSMVVYPILVQFLELDELAAGVVIGGTIHDVAQVVGAGFSISENAGDTATVVKLIRVMMLAPVVLIASIIIRNSSASAVETSGRRPPLVPFFIIMFLLLAAINSFLSVPPKLQSALSDASRWALLIAIASVGMKTSLKMIFEVGGQAVALLCVETLFILGIILYGITHFSG